MEYSIPIRQLLPATTLTAYKIDCNHVLHTFDFKYYFFHFDSCHVIRINMAANARMYKLLQSIATLIHSFNHGHVLHVSYFDFYCALTLFDLWTLYKIFYNYFRDIYCQNMESKIHLRAMFAQKCFPDLAILNLT